MTPKLTKRGAYFIAVFTGPDGKRTRKSTGMTTEAAALAVLNQLVREAENARAGISPPSGSGKLATRHPAALAGDFERALVGRGRTADYADAVCISVRKAIDVMGWASISHLTPNAAAVYQQHLAASGVSSGTVRLRVAHLRSFFSWLHRTGTLSHDPGIGFGKVKVTGETRRRPLTEAEASALLSCDTIPAEARRVYATLLYTGLRIDRELGNLVWGNVEAGTMRVQGKGGKWRSVPIADALVPVLEAQRKARPFELRVFPEIPSPAEFQHHLRAAGIDRSDSRGWVASRHSLRHTWSVWMYESGATDVERAALAGHSPRVAVETYSDARAERLRGAINRLPRLTA